MKLGFNIFGICTRNLVLAAIVLASLTLVADDSFGMREERKGGLSCEEGYKHLQSAQDAYDIIYHNYITALKNCGIGSLTYGLTPAQEACIEPFQVVYEMSQEVLGSWQTALKAQGCEVDTCKGSLTAAICMIDSK